MNGKKPSWLLRAGSFLLAALMVFGNLYLPNGFLKASAAEESTTLFSADFEDASSISIGTSIYSGNRGWQVQGGTIPAGLSVSVEEVNGNKVLALTKSVAGTSSAALDLKFDLFAGTNTDTSIKSAVLSYNIAMTNSMQMFFPTICNANNVNMAAYFGSNNGPLVYSTTGGSKGDDTAWDGWNDLYTGEKYEKTSNIETYKWYTVKQVYTLADGENAAKVEVYIDGVLTHTENALNVPSDIGGIVMKLHKWSNVGTTYIDNIQFTTGDHTPAKTPVTCRETWFEETFENHAAGTVLNTVTNDSWHDTATKATYSVVNDPTSQDSDNKVLQLAYNANNGSGQTISSVYSLLPSLTQAVLEYDVWPSADDTLYLPVFTCSGGAQPVYLVARPNGVLKYRPSASSADELSIGTANDFLAERWHKVKLVVDTVSNQFHIYIDGKYFVTDTLRVQTPVTCIQGGSYTSTGDNNTYFDNFKVSPFIPVDTFTLTSSASVNLEVGKSSPISYSVVPAGASAKDVVITSSNAAVAAVENGAIVAKSAGTATITLDPVQAGVESKTVAVTVTEPVVNKVLYQTGFESTDSEAFTVGDFGTSTSKGDHWVYDKYSNWSENGDVTYNSEYASVRVKNINGNQVLSLWNDAVNATDNTRKIELRRNNFTQSDEVWVSYHFAVDSTGTVAYAPAVAGPYGVVAYFGINGGVWKYRNSSGTDIKMEYVNEEDGELTVVPNKWYTVELHYSKNPNSTLAYNEKDSTNQPIVEIYIDGKLTNAANFNLYNQHINRMMMELSSWGNGGELFVDNIQVSTLRHVPAEKPASLQDLTPVEILNLDFSDGKTDALTFTTSDTTKVEVVEINNNKLLSVLNSNTGSHFEISWHSASEFKEYTSYTLSYHIGFEALKTVYLPALADKNGMLMRMGSAVNCGGVSGLFGYSMDGTNWTAIQAEDTTIGALSPMTWYTVKIVYDASGDTPVIKTYVDGKLTNVEATRTVTPTGFVMNVTKWSGGKTVYIDDLRITSGIHEPGQKPASLIPESEGADIYFFEDFTGDTNATCSLSLGERGFRVTKFEDNDVLEVYLETAVSSNLTAFKSGLSYPKVVMDYKVYFTGNCSSTVYLPTLRGSELYGEAVQFALRPSGQIALNGQIVLATLSTNAWHDIRIVGDVNTYKWYLFVDGVYVPYAENNLKTLSNGTKITAFSGVNMGTYRGPNNEATFSEIYYDDIKLSEYLAVTDVAVAQTAYELTVGESAQLNVTFASEYAALPVATYASANTAVATVDAAGKITAVGAGETTITVTAIGETAVSKTVTVKVNPAPLVNTTYLDTGFEANEATPYISGTSIYGQNNSINGWTITYWGAAHDQDKYGSVSIKTINGNQVLSLKTLCEADGSSRKDRNIKVAYTGLNAGGNVWVTFNVGVMKVGTTTFFPAPVVGTKEAAYYGFNGTKVQYQDGLWNDTLAATDPRYNQWDDIVLYGTTTKPAAPVAQTWYAIKLHYVNDPNGGYVELWINGQKMNNITKGDVSGAFTGLYMELNKWGTAGECEMLIDNVKVTNFDHEPATPSAGLESPIVLNTGFEAADGYADGHVLAEGSSYNGWKVDYATNNVGNASIKTIENADGTKNQVLAVSTTQREGSGNTDVVVYYDLPKNLDYAVLTYNVVRVSDAGVLFFPSLGNSGTYATRFGYMSGVLQWWSKEIRGSDTSAKEYANIMKNTAATPTDIAHEVMKWHKVKVIYQRDTETGLFTTEVWIDGVKTSTANYDQQTPSTMQVNRIQLAASKFGTGMMYIDNICLTTDGSNPELPTLEDLRLDPIDYAEDFSDWNVGNVTGFNATGYGAVAGWSAANPEQIGTSIRVMDINGNKVLALTRYDTLNEMHPIRYNILDRELKQATLTYNVAVSSHGMAAGFPSLTNRPDGTGVGAHRLINIGTYNGKLMYAPNGGGWFDVFAEPTAIVPYTWYNVKQTYSIDAQGVVTTELYINGVLTNVERAYDEVPNISSVLMALNTNGTAGTMFIDNIHLTEGDLENEPVANDQLAPLVDFFEDFESITLTEGVGIWGNAPDGFRVVEDTETGNGLEIYHDGSNVYTATAMAFEQVQLQTVIEYTLSYKKGNFETNLLTADAAGTAPIRLVLNTSTGEIYDPATSAVLATIEEKKSYAIKLVVDTEKAAMYVWVNGTYVGQVAAMAEAIASVSMQTIAGVACQGVYLDNITVSEYVPATSFTATAAGVENALVYKSYPIVVKLNPLYASVDAYSFQVVEGENIVSVNALGNIYAKAVGTAKIHVIHPQMGVQEIIVNVTGVYDPEPIMEQTFDSYNDGDNTAALMAGSAIGDYATVYDKNGNKVLQVSNPDKDNHGHAYIQFKDENGTVKSYDGKVYLSYYLAVNNVEGHFYIPTLGQNSGKGATISAHGDGFFKYTINGNDWFVLKYTDDEGGEVGYKKMTWYLIEFEFTGGANPDLQMKINGRPVEIKHNGLTSVNSIAMQMTKWMINGNKDAYIDNIRVTEIPHEPMAAPSGNLNVVATGIVLLDEQGNPIDTTDAPYEIEAKNPILLTALTIPGGATDKTYTLSSSNREVADIDTNGYLVGYENGETVITATLTANQNISASIRVKVNAVAVESITISCEQNALYVGGHCFATATVNPTNTSYSTIRWVSENTDVVKVDSYGEIVAVGAGTAVIYAYSEHDEVESNKITITVTEPAEVKTITVSDVAELRAALEQIKQINAAGGMTGNVVIELEGGYYYLESTLNIGPEHSGTNGYSLVIRAKSGETPVIGGAYTVPNNWTVYDSEKNIYAVTVAEGVESRQMYVNNVRATRARSTGGLTSSNFLYNSDGVNIGYTCYNTEFLSFARPDDLELVFKEQWTQPRAGVAQIRAGAKPNSVELIMDQPAWSGGTGNGSSVTNKGGTSAQADGPVWYENAYELLDEPGEWYLDTATNTLYYIPRVWEDMNEVKVTLPVFDNSVEEGGKYPLAGGDGALVHISGTFNDEKKNDVATQVQNIHFEGITFADTTWMRPSSNHGHSDAQNNHIRENGDTMAPGAVVVEAANAIWFNDCTFTRMGINALQLQNGAQNSFVIGNHFYDISGNAITVGEPGTELDNAYAQGLNTVKNNDILNNYIHNIGVDFGSSAAISVGFAADMDMSYNEIFDTPYSGWHIGYGWNTRFKNNNKNMMIEYNFVHDIMDQDIYDGGAFYFLGNMSGEGYNDGYSYLRRNYIRKQMNAHGGIYPDQGTTYLKIVENVIDLSEVDSWFNGNAPKWSHTNQVCQHIHYINNFTTTQKHSYSAELNFERDDIVGIGSDPTGITVVPDAQWTDPVALDVVANAGLQGEYKYLRNNQVERVVINVDGEDVLLDKNGTFALQVAAADGRDNAINSGYSVYFDSLNPEVATVSDSGVITGVETGMAIIRVYVVSNGVLDQFDVRTVVSDVPENIVIKGVSEDITMSMTAIKTLDTMVVTALGREIEPENVTFGVVNEAIAVVENGVLKPVATGVTSLVVTATAQGVTLTEVFRVEIVEEITFDTVDASDMFAAENEMYWYQNGSKDWVLTDGVSINSVVGNSGTAGFANYTGNLYENQLMSFKLKIANPGGWPSIVLRAQDNSGYVSQGPSGYIFCMGKNGLELYRFIGSIRHVIRGSLTTAGWQVLPGAEVSLKPAESGFTYTSDGVAEHDIKVGAISDGDYVRILLYVDGNKVIDYLDKEGAIVEPGYFGVIGKGETFTITKATGVETADAPEAEVNGVTYPTLEAAIAAAHASGQAQTVKVLEDTAVDSILLNGVTLDLNGKKLEANYLISFGADVIDSTGGSAVLKVKDISLSKNNAQLPVWDEAAGGYRFFSGVSYQKLVAQSEDGFQFACKPALGGKANDIFMAQSATNGLTVKIRMSWATASGNPIDQMFTFKAEDVAKCYADEEQILYLKVTGAAPYVNNLKVTTYIVSETGVEWLAEPGVTFVGSNPTPSE